MQGHLAPSRDMKGGRDVGRKEGTRDKRREEMAVPASVGPSSRRADIRETENSWLEVTMVTERLSW